jgi:Mycobacterium membrane protein
MAPPDDAALHPCLISFLEKNYDASQLEAWAKAYKSAPTGDSPAHVEYRKALLAARTACTSPSPPTTTTIPPTGKGWVLTVTGTSPAYIAVGALSYSSQELNAILPWSETLPGTTDALSLNPQTRDNSLSATIKCSISYDGKTLDSRQASGPYAVTYCASKMP